MSRMNRAVVAVLATLAAGAAFAPAAAQAQDEEPCVGEGPLAFCVNDPELAILDDPPIYCLYGGGDIWICPPYWD